MSGLLYGTTPSCSILHRQRSIMGGAGPRVAPAGLAGGATTPRFRQQRRRRAAVCASWGQEEPPKDLHKDPEAKFRQYGEHFGKGYFMQGVMEMNVPRVRVRTSRDRARDQLADLAVLNERLSGKDSNEAAHARHRLEYMKRRRRNWEMVYQDVTRADALCTLAAIEEANTRVEELLSEESRERHSVSALKKQLMELQGDVAQAHERLHLTQARVEQNLARISELKAESARLGDTVQRAQQQQQQQAEGGSDLSAAAAGLAAANPAAATSAAGVLEEMGSAPAPAALRAGNARSEEAGNGASAPPALQAAVAASHAALAPGHALNRACGGTGPRGTAHPLSLEQDIEVQRRRGLYASLEMEEELKNHWFAVAFVSKLGPEDKKTLDLFGQAWVLFRDESGRAACILDECAHRACPLSIGDVKEGQIHCPYHGWRFNGKGECTKMPSTVLTRGVAVSALPTVEHDGFVWVWPGWEEPTLPLPTFTRPPEGYRIHAEIEVEVPVEHGLLVENLLDLAHAPFTHTTTFARGWPVPDAVKFHASRLLGGNWDPYPIEMSFNPPCCTLSHVGLARPGKAGSGATPQECQNHLHQLHVCLPARAGHTRLLYRMSTDFLWWTELIPGIQRFWRHIAGQVLGEDLVLVVGQQDRLLRGGDTWRHPVSYDKLAVRYRRWRNSLVLNGTVAAAQQLKRDQETGSGSEPASEDGTDGAAPAITMRSGEIFELEDDDYVFVDLPGSHLPKVGSS